MATKAIDVRKGMAVNYKDSVWAVVSNEKVAKGNWRSYQVVQLKNITTGQLIKERFRTDEMFEETYLERKPMEYLYSSGSSHVVMDNESYEQVELPADLIGEDSIYLVPNITLQVALIDGKPVTVELPNTVNLKVVDTPPQVKGGTATNQLKEAVCEGGARIKVPAFVENGQSVRVDTRSGEYLGKVQ